MREREREVATMIFFFFFYNIPLRRADDVLNKSRGFAVYEKGNTMVLRKSRTNTYISDLLTGGKRTRIISQFLIRIYT